jgi:hypothetical protein
MPAIPLGPAIGLCNSLATKLEAAMRPTLTALLASLCLTAAQPAAADLLITGRAAQALHCSAMLFIVSAELHEAGFVSRTSRDRAQRAALIMLDFVPGSDEQRQRAMEKRFERILKTRTPAELFKEYDSTARWCRKTFLK